MGVMVIRESSGGHPWVRMGGWQKEWQELVAQRQELQDQERASWRKWYDEQEENRVKREALKEQFCIEKDEKQRRAVELQEKDQSWEHTKHNRHNRVPWEHNRNDTHNREHNRHTRHIWHNRHIYICVKISSTLFDVREPPCRGKHRNEKYMFEFIGNKS